MQTYKQQALDKSGLARGLPTIACAVLAAYRIPTRRSRSLMHRKSVVSGMCPAAMWSVRHAALCIGECVGFAAVVKGADPGSKLGLGY